MVFLLTCGVMVFLGYKARNTLPGLLVQAVFAYTRGFVRAINKPIQAPPRETGIAVDGPEPETVLPGTTENRASNLPRETLTRVQARTRKDRITQATVLVDDSGEVTMNGMVIGWLDQTAKSSQFCPAWDAPCDTRDSPETAWHDATDYAETLLERR